MFQQLGLKLLITIMPFVIHIHPHQLLLCPLQDQRRRAAPLPWIPSLEQAAPLPPLTPVPRFIHITTTKRNSEMVSVSVAPCSCREAKFWIVMSRGAYSVEHFSNATRQLSVTVAIYADKVGEAGWKRVNKSENGISVVEETKEY